MENRNFTTVSEQIHIRKGKTRPGLRNALYMAMCILAAAFAFAPEAAFAFPRHAMTDFNPHKYGFHFNNTFTNDLVPKALHHTGLNIHTEGLCGGMVYAALDYYYAHKHTPNVDYRPATGTVLARYIYHREVHSIETNIPEWINMHTNPFGSRNAQLFKRGLNGKHGKALYNLESYIARGAPVVLDLKGFKEQDHQVLAIGYNLGRYNGHFGPYESDVRIMLYNPNNHDHIDSFVPEPAHHVWKDLQTGKTFRGFFVDTKYHPKRPPRLSYRVYPHDSKIHELILHFIPGNKRLYGGTANLNLRVVTTLGSGKLPPYPDINLSASWLPNYDEYVRVRLPQALTKRQIRKLVLTDTFRSGINHDKWKMKHLTVYGLENNRLVPIGGAGSMFFTIRNKQLDIPIG